MNAGTAVKGFSLWVLETCPDCRGTGKFGSGGMHTIICETCENSRIAWVERLRLV